MIINFVLEDLTSDVGAPTAAARAAEQVASQVSKHACGTLHFHHAAKTVMQIDIIADYWPSCPEEQGFGSCSSRPQGQQSAVTAYYRV